MALFVHIYMYRQEWKHELITCDSWSSHCLSSFILPQGHFHSMEFYVWSWLGQTGRDVFYTYQGIVTGRDIHYASLCLIMRKATEELQANQCLYTFIQSRRLSSPPDLCAHCMVLGVLHATSVPGHTARVELHSCRLWVGRPGNGECQCQDHDRQLHYTHWSRISIFHTYWMYLIVVKRLRKNLNDAWYPRLELLKKREREQH